MLVPVEHDLGNKKLEYLFPQGGYSSVIDIVQSVLQVLTHDNGAIYGQFKVHQCGPDR